jgi:predicted alpha/beta hydrolase
MRLFFKGGRVELFQIQTSDGTLLAASRFMPQTALKAVVLLPSAMGVPQSFYTPFAEFLAENGIAVVCFDYRGMGASIPAEFRHSLRGFDTSVTQWAEQDYNAALLATKAWQSEVPLIVVGHSLGGQLLGMLPDAHLIDAVITIASGSGYWRENAPQLKRIVWLMWYFVVPLATRLCGYFPGKRLRMVGDLPKGVIYQWARWCKHPAYFVDENGAAMQTGHAAIRRPILSMSFTDDELMSLRNIESMHSFYSNAVIERRHIHPGDVDAKRIGHFGFFRTQFRNSLWLQALHWMTNPALKRSI